MELFTIFSNFFESNNEYTIVPHVSDGNVMCFWYIGKKENNFSKEFYHFRLNRPFINELLIQMIKEKDFQTLNKLSEDIKNNHVKIKIKDNKKIIYNKKEYSVNDYAYLEAVLKYKKHFKIQNKL